MMSKLMHDEGQALKDNKRFIYQYFVESMKYGFAQRTNLGDLFKNELKNTTMKVRGKVEMCVDAVVDCLDTGFFLLMYYALGQKHDYSVSIIGG